MPATLPATSTATSTATENFQRYYEEAGPDYGAWSPSFNMHFGFFPLGHAQIPSHFRRIRPPKNDPRPLEQHPRPDPLALRWLSRRSARLLHRQRNAHLT